MSAYLIEVQDTEDGVVSPTLIGPFADASAALTFQREWLPDEDGPPNGKGGYYAVHVIADETCNYSPENYMQSFGWKRDVE